MNLLRNIVICAWAGGITSFFQGNGSEFLWVAVGITLIYFGKIIRSYIEEPYNV